MLPTVTTEINNPDAEFLSLVQSCPIHPGDMPVPSAELSEKIFAIEKVMLGLPQVELPVTHQFTQGVYTRTITVPAGVWMTGAVHRMSNMNFLLKGRVTIITENGPVELSAPAILPSPAGTKRFGFVHEEMVWSTVLGTDLTDPEEIEAVCTFNDPEEHRRMLKYPEQLSLIEEK
jgi:hypothetical protein